MVDESAYQERQRNLLRARLRRLTAEHDEHRIQIVATLPTEAPARVLLRTTTSRDLFMGNGSGRPLSRFTATE